MLRLFWPLFWATVVAAVYEYDGEVPTIKIKYSEDKDAKESTGLLTMATVDTLVLSKECAEKDTCTLHKHDNVYDKDRYNGQELLPFEKDYLNFKLKGTQYAGPFIFGNYKSNSAPIFAVETVEKDKLDLPQDALVGLDFGDKLSNGFAINNFMKNAGNGKKVMIFRTGPFIQQLKKKEIKTAKGKFEIGETTLAGCGNFKMIPTIANKGWKAAATVTIGGTEYKTKTISFSFDKVITVPTTIYDAKFKDKGEADLPEISINFGGDNNFTINKENLQNYGDDKHEKLEVLVKDGAPEDEIILGKNFLSDYCIGLKSNDEQNKFEIWLAPITEKKKDPQWEEYDDGNGGGGQGGGGGGGKGGKGDEKGKGAFTASCSVLLNVLSASILALFARLAQ